MLTMPDCLPQSVSAGPQLKAFAIVLREEFGVAFQFYDGATGQRLDSGSPGEAGGSIAGVSRASLAQLADEGRPRVSMTVNGEYRLALPLNDPATPHLVAVGAIAAVAHAPQQMAVEQGRLEKWLQSVQDRLCLSALPSSSRRRADGQEAQLAVAWDAIMGLDQLLRGMRITRDSSREKKRILQRAAALIRAQALIWVPADADESIVIEGELPLSSWDCSQLAHLLVQSPDWDKAGYLVLDQIQSHSWGPRFPKLANLLALAVTEKTPLGWLIALNKGVPHARTSRPRDKEAAGPGSESRSRALGLEGLAVPFRRTDAALLMPFAALVGNQVRSSRRYHQLKELLVGLTRSLTAAIDAKDSYTYGHSERVARVAVELGREMGLQDDEVSDIYLAGLLHDIGKIGIQDSILGKREPLTPVEFEHIQQHVKIGYRILANLRPIAHLLPGVLYHHERYDGQGYPEGLAGDAIPFLARILAVADSYDAMSTTRPYRTAMPPARVEEILREGIETQWDRKVVDAFFRCKERIHAIRQRGVGESLCTALDGALRGQNDVNECPSLLVQQPLGR